MVSSKERINIIESLLEEGIKRRDRVSCHHQTGKKGQTKTFLGGRVGGNQIFYNFFQGDSVHTVKRK